MSDVILGAWHGGLGDSLQFSTLPEEFYNSKEEKHISGKLLRSEIRKSMIYYGERIPMLKVRSRVKGMQETLQNILIEIRLVTGLGIGNQFMD